MKKIFMAALAALASLSASADSGDQAIGIHGQYATDMENIGIGVKYQYYLTDHFRVEGVADYFIRKNGFDMWDAKLNVHYLVPMGNSISIYPILGLNYTHTELELEPSSFDKGGLYKRDSFGFNGGAGVQYDFSDDWNIHFELKYQTITKYDTPIFSFGIAHTF